MLFTIEQIKMYILKQGEGGLYPVISNLTEENILAANKPFVHLEEDYDDKMERLCPGYAKMAEDKMMEEYHDSMENYYEEPYYTNIQESYLDQVDLSDPKQYLKASKDW